MLGVHITFPRDTEAYARHECVYILRTSVASAAIIYLEPPEKYIILTSSWRHQLHSSVTILLLCVRYSLSLLSPLHGCVYATVAFFCHHAQLYAHYTDTPTHLMQNKVYIQYEYVFVNGPMRQCYNLPTLLVENERMYLFPVARV